MCIFIRIIHHLSPPSSSFFLIFLRRNCSKPINEFILLEIFDTFRGENGKNVSCAFFCNLIHIFKLLRRGKTRQRHLVSLQRSLLQNGCHNYYGRWLGLSAPNPPGAIWRGRARQFQPSNLVVSAIRGLSFHAVRDYYSLAG